MRRACRRRDIQRVEGNGQLAIRFANDHPAAVMKIILPGAVRVFRAVDEDVTRRRIGLTVTTPTARRAGRDNPPSTAPLVTLTRSMLRPVKEAPRGHVISQPLAIRRPDADIG